MAKSGVIILNNETTFEDVTAMSASITSPPSNPCKSSSEEKNKIKHVRIYVHCALTLRKM